MTYSALGSEFDVNSTYARSQGEADSAQLANGNIVVVWRDLQVGTSADQFVRAQILKPDGTPVGPEFTLLSGSGVQPAVTGLAGGGFVVTWDSFSGIRAQAFDANGTPAAPSFAVSPANGSSVDRPDVAALANGGFAIAWEDGRASGADSSGTGVYIRAFDANGAASPEALVNVSIAGNQADPSITALPDGGYLVTWTDRGLRTATDSPPWLVKARFFDSAGVPAGSEFVVNSSTTGASSVESSVTVLANGNIAIAWYDTGHHIQIFDTSAHRIGTQIDVQSGLSGIQVGPEIAALADGGFALAWTANVAPLSDGSGRGVFVQVFDSAAQPTGEPMLANSQTVGDQWDPSIVALPGRGFMVTWSDFNSTGSGGDDDQVKAQIFVPVEPVTITSAGGGDTGSFTIMERDIYAGQVVAESGGSSAGIHYAITGGADAALFRIDPETGLLGFATAPDYEAPASADGDNSYEVQVRADNGAYSDAQLITVAVQNVNERPVITSDGGGTSASFTLPENGTAVTTVVGSDPDGDPILYRINPDNNDFALFAIDGATGVLTFVGVPDYEAPSDFGADNFYRVTVEVTDGTPGWSAFQTIEILVTNVNEGVTISSFGGAEAAALTAAENQTAVATVTATDLDGDTVAYSIAGGADAALFTIDSATGAVSFVSAPDHEVALDADGDNVYEVGVVASDGTLSDTQALSITVENVNEAPTISSNGGGDSAAVTIAENQVAVTSVSAGDVDGDGVSYSIIGGADAASFTINSTTGALSFVTAPDYDAPGDADHNDVYEVAVAAGDGTLSDVQLFSVAVSNVNEAPVITSGGGGSSAGVTINENSSLVTIVSSTDPEGAVRTYSISGGADSALFAINSGTGVLSFVSAPNYEAPADTGRNNIYDVIVSVSDGTLTDTQAVAVNVANIVDGVTLTGTNGGNTLNGTVAEDTLRGLGGNDTLNGGAGVDLLDGGAGNDTLTGGAGADTLIGGAGADRFAFASIGDSTAVARDVISDFSRSDKDRISLSDIDANINVGGDQKFSFIGTAAFTGAAGQLHYEQSGGNTLVMGDVNGDRVADFVIQVTGLVTFTSGDFLL